MMEQAEEMRKVTVERDTLHRRLLRQSEASPTSSGGLTDDGGMIAALYDTDHKAVGVLSGKHMQCVVSKCFGASLACQTALDLF